MSKKSERVQSTRWNRTTGKVHIRGDTHFTLCGKNCYALEWRKVEAEATCLKCRQIEELNG